jgi:murein DD-endopeptidase MepM/ murein hydrolase activator NlpD
MTYISKHLGFELLCIGVVVVLPLSVHAGAFSALFDTATAETVEEVVIPDSNMQMMPLLRAAIHTDPSLAKGGGDIVVENGALVPSGDSDGKDTTLNTKTGNGEINTYVVREGDTLSEIADMYGVSEKTILWANSISNASKIRPGDTLVILPITGVRHVVKKGDTIQSIAKKYTGDVGDILGYNQLASEADIKVGDTVVVPDGTVSAPPLEKNVEKKSVKTTASVNAKNGTGGAKVASGGGSSAYTNPLPGSIQTQGIHGYNGVDLSGVPVGTSVLAALSGEVIVAKNSGWNGGYGSYVVIKHGNGTQTLYAHLASVSVEIGERVAKGAVLGGMGNSGRSTGPHLHFEVRGARNPF